MVVPSLAPYAPIANAQKPALCIEQIPLFSRTEPLDFLPIPAFWSWGFTAPTPTES